MFKRLGYISRTKRAEARVRELESELQTERDTNRRREDELLNKVLQAAGQFGLPTVHTEPHRPPPPEPKAAPMSALDESLYVELQNAAEAAGRPRQDGIKAYWAQKKGVPLEFPQDDYQEVGY